MSSNESRRGVLVKLPREIKSAVVDGVMTREASMNDILVGVLANHYAVPFTRTGRRGYPNADKEAVLLRMTDALKYRIQLDALERRSNMNDTICEILASHFGVGVPPRRSVRETPFGGGRRAA